MGYDCSVVVEYQTSFGEWLLFSDLRYEMNRDTKMYREVWGFPGNTNGLPDDLSEQVEEIFYGDVLTPDRMGAFHKYPDEIELPTGIDSSWYWLCEDLLPLAIQRFGSENVRIVGWFKH